MKCSLNYSQYETIENRLAIRQEQIGNKTRTNCQCSWPRHQWRTPLALTIDPWRSSIGRSSPRFPKVFPLKFQMTCSHPALSSVFPLQRLPSSFRPSTWLTLSHKLSNFKELQYEQPILGYSIKQAYSFFSLIVLLTSETWDQNISFHDILRPYKTYPHFKLVYL